MTCQAGRGLSLNRQSDGFSMLLVKDVEGRLGGSLVDCGCSSRSSSEAFLGETEGPFLGADLHAGAPGAQAGSRRLRAAGVDALTPPSTRRRWTSRWTVRISRQLPVV